MLASRMPSEWLSALAEGTSLPTNALGKLADQGFFVISIGLSWYFASSRGVKLRKVLFANTSLLLFYLYFICSPLWSGDPADSLIRILKDFGLTVVVLAAIMSEKQPEEALRAVFVRCASILIPLSVFFSRFTFAGFGRTYALNGAPMITGVNMYKNSLGEMVMVFGLFLVWDHLETRPANSKWPWSGMRWDVLVLSLMGLYLLKASDSKTSLVLLLIGLGLIYGRGVFGSRGASTVLFLSVLSLPYPFLSRFSYTVAPALNAIGRDASFTGRTDIWKHITLTTVNPWVGEGFYNFWGGPGGRAIQTAMQSGVPNAHNGYLDIFLDGGLIGVALLGLVFVASGIELLHNLRVSRYYQFRFTLLIVAILGGCTESNFGRMSVLWFVTVLALVEFPFMKGSVTSDRQQQNSTSEGDRAQLVNVDSYQNASYAHATIPAVNLDLD
jgi:O-antigen ligase